MAISSHIPSQIPQDVYILTSTEQKMADLPKKSLIKLGKIITINQSLIRKKIGKLPEQTVTSILRQFNLSIISEHK